MLSKEWMIKNTEIASEYLKHFSMYRTPETTFLDICYFPSFRDKCYYIQLFKNDRIYTAFCAYTSYMDYRGLVSYSVPFTKIREMSNNSGVKTDVICKIIYLDSTFVNDIISKMDLINESQLIEKAVIIDGDHGIIRSFENGLINKCIVMDSSDEYNDLKDCLQRLSDKI